MRVTAELRSLSPHVAITVDAKNHRATVFINANEVFSLPTDKDGSSYGIVTTRQLEEAYNDLFGEEL